MTVDYAQVLSGADNPCPFPVTFTVTVTTFTDELGTPIRQAIHGALTHTLFSHWHTLVSNGSAPSTSIWSVATWPSPATNTPLRVPGARVVLGQSGRLVQAPDGSQLSFTGLSTLDAAMLCAALTPEAHAASAQARRRSCGRAVCAGSRTGQLSRERSPARTASM
jgi:hypothetical protein